MKNKRNNTKIIYGCILTLLIIVIYWLWLFYTTQLSTVSNTYECKKSITNVKVHLAAHRGTDKLFIYTNENSYILETGWRNEDKTQKLAKQLLSIKEEVIFTVQKYIPKSIFDYNFKFDVSEQIIDMRNNAQIYYDILDYNSFQRRERTSGIIFGAVFSPIVFTFVIFILLFLKNQR
ncbi:MAG: hypothetical protein E7524_04005 [Ruminococcaceae bacterium]|nr:hypothetical protein [Oscillospiraceae bacterium]